MSSKKLIAVVIKLFVTVLLFTFLFRPHTFGLRPDLFGGVTPLKMIRELQGIPLRVLIPWLAFAVVVKLSGVMAGVLRWWLLLKGQGLRVPIMYLVESWFIGRCLGIFLPSTIGLDGYRLYDSVRYSGELLKCATVMIVEKIAAFVAMSVLVFVTFPFAFRLLDMSRAFMALVMVAVGCTGAIIFVAMMNPHVMQIVAATIPAPQRVHRRIYQLAAAIGAFQGKRRLLAAAVGCSILLHLGTVAMYFATMMAVRGEQGSFLEALRATPVMIYGTLISPSIAGEGVREILFAKVLGPIAGNTGAVLVAHLGFWVGEFLPFIIGAPIFVLKTRTSAKLLRKDAIALGERAPELEVKERFSTPQIKVYRRHLLDCLLMACAAGLLAGAVLGLLEAAWIVARLEHSPETTALWWGPLFYGPMFGIAGFALHPLLAFWYLVRDRFTSPSQMFFVMFAAILGLGIAVVGWHLVRRDLLAGHPPGASQTLFVLVLAGFISLLGYGIASSLLRSRRLRRRWLIAFALTGHAAIACVGWVAAAATTHPVEEPIVEPEAKSEGPDIIIMIADALRADYLQLYNSAAKAKTPAIDALAEDAIVYTRAFAQGGWSKPAFASLYTGLYPFEHTANHQLSALPDSVTTIAEALSARGYYTIGTGNNENVRSSSNYDQGFERFADLDPDYCLGASLSASRLTLYQVWRRIALRAAGKMRAEHFYQPAPAIVQFASDNIERLRSASQAPVFLVLHFMDTHDPFIRHDREGAGFARAMLGPNPNPSRILEPMQAAYVSEIEYLDSNLRKLWALLESTGMYEDSLIVFTADHGEEFFDHGGWWHGTQLFDETIRVPLIVKMPGNMHGGEVIDHIVQHIDLAPTLLEAAGIQPNPEMSGHALLTDGQLSPPREPNYAYASTDLMGNRLKAIRTQTHKLIYANDDNPRGFPPVMLFDLEADPTEKHNLAGNGLPAEARLRLLMTRVRSESVHPSVRPIHRGAMTEEELKRFIELGYSPPQQ